MKGAENSGMKIKQERREEEWRKKDYNSRWERKNGREWSKDSWIIE